MAGTGQLRFSFTWENREAKGVALSRARAHQIRLTCFLLGGGFIGSAVWCETYGEECAEAADHY